MNKKISFLIVFIFFLLGFFIIFYPTKYSLPENIQYVKIAGKNIKVELALTTEDQMRGLSGRSGFKKDEGMLFIFPVKASRFWMKDMNFPLDIIWINKDKKVIFIKKDARPESYPRTFGPDVGSRYVLEVVSGFADENNLNVGDMVKFY